MRKLIITVTKTKCDYENSTAVGCRNGGLVSRMQMMAMEWSSLYLIDSMNTN